MEDHPTITEIIDGAQPLEPQEEDSGSQAVPADDPQPAAPRSLGFDVEKINNDHALALMGSGAVVVKEQPAGPIEDRLRLLSIPAFHAWYANKPTEIVGHDGRIKTVTYSQAWMKHRDRRSYVGVEFFPNPDGVPNTPGYLNLWRGFSVAPSPKGTYKIFRDHLLTNVCNGDQSLFDWLFAWFAHIVQRPRERVGTAVVLRGAMGSGKTKVGEVIGSLFSAHYYQVDDPRYITGNFNSHMAACLLLQAEEAIWAGDKTAEGRLKGLITSESQMIEAKGIDAIRIQNFIRVLLTSNEDWVVPAGKDERRFFVLDVDPRCAQNHEYFREMDEELNDGGREALLYDLLRVDLSKVNLRQIPRTNALFEQKLRSLDPMDSWWYGRLVDGAPTRGCNTWPGEIGTSALYADYIRSADETGVHRKRDAATFGLKLTKLVPGLERTRPRVETEPGVTKRVWCYALPKLATCRAAFETSMGQPIGWPPLPDGEEIAEPPMATEDDEIPV